MVGRQIANISIGVVLSLLPAIAAAQTLHDSVQRAVTGHPRVHAIQNNRQAVDQELRQARGLYLPQLDVRAGIGPEWTDSPSTRARGNGSTSLTRKELSVVLQQRLFDGFEADSEVERQKARSKSAAFRVFETSEFIGLDAVQAHLNVLRQRRLVQIATENVEVHRRYVDLVRQRSEGGRGTRADLAQARSRLEQAIATSADTENGLRDAEASYIRVVGDTPGGLGPSPLPVAALPSDLQAALEWVESNPTVAISLVDVTVAEKEIDVAESRFYPKLNLELGGRSDNDLDGIPGRDRDAFALFVMRWNLYRGGSDVANRRKALAAYAQARNLRLDTLRQFAEDMRRAWAAYQATTIRIDSLRIAVTQARAVRDAYRQQFDLNQRSLLDLLDSENEYFVTLAQVTIAEFARDFQGFRILAFGGRLLRTLEVEPPAEANPAMAAPLPPGRDQGMRK